MKPGSDFAPVGATGRMATVLVDGAPVAMAAGDTLAAGLLAAGIGVFRETPGAAAPRGPFCMMGACYDCLVEIDGRTAQACMTAARDGLSVRRLLKGDAR